MKKMVMAVIPEVLSNIVLEGLARAGFVATYGESRGGMMHQSKSSLFIVVEPDEVDQVIHTIRENLDQTFHAKEVDKQSDELTLIDPDKGGSAVFTWDVDRIETL
jgi:uncharacterized protein YaaQ